MVKVYKNNYKKQCQFCKEDVEVGCKCLKRVEITLDCYRPCLDNYVEASHKSRFLAISEEVRLKISIIDEQRTIVISGRFVTSDMRVE